MTRTPALQNPPPVGLFVRSVMTWDTQRLLQATGDMQQRVKICDTHIYFDCVVDALLGTGISGGRQEGSTKQCLGERVMIARDLTCN